MAIEFNIEVRNGRVKITLGNGGSRSQGQGGLSGGLGGEGPIDGPGPGGGEPGSADSRCCGTTVIGPIVVNSTAMQGQDGVGGEGPIDGPGPGGGKGGEGPIDGPGPGGGGPEGGCGCGGTTVIGPIVISGCAGPSQSSPPATLPTPQAITLDPLPQTITRILHDGPPPVFTMQPQLESEWCWAAVAASIHDFLDPGASLAWTQGRLATQVVEADLNLSPGSLDCTASPLQKKCNRPERLDAALKITGNLSSLGVKTNQYLVFDSIKNWVASQLPIAARVVWNRGGAHFIVLDGYRESAAAVAATVQMVHVQDPLYGPGFVLYDELAGNYQQLLTGGGRWQDTYPVQA